MSDFTTLARMAASQYGLLTKPQLQAMGWSTDQISYRLRQGWLCQYRRNIYVLAGATDSWEQRVCAAALAASPIGAASHRSAARLWGFRTVDDEVEVSIRYPRRLCLTDAVVHRSRDLVRSDITLVNDIPTTTPERTICDLGLIFPRKEVERILWHAIATGLVNRYDMYKIRYRTGRQGRNGTGVLGKVLAALPDHAENTDSGAEVAFLALCKRFNIPAPALQVPVVVNGSRYRLDFAYVLARVFIEVDGVASHSGPEQIANDEGRQNDLVSEGWTPIRFTSKQLRTEPNRCAETILRTLDL